MAEPRIVDVSSVRIDGKNYRLARAGNRQPYVHGFEDEPPWQGGAPSIIDAPQETWHLGGLKSEAGIPGSSEYGQNTDPRFAKRLLPSALITDLTLTSSGGTPISICEALGYIWVVTGRRVYRIDPATDTVVLSKDFGASINAVQCLRWEADYVLVTTDEASNSLYKLTAITPGGPDAGWTQTSTVTAYRLAVGVNRLYKVSKSGVLRNISTGLDPMTEANWADSVQVGETSTLPTALLAYQRTVFVGKPEGFFGVGDDGFGLPLIKRMSRETNNCYGMALLDPWVLIPHVRGLFRYQPELVEACGLEKEIMNESPIRGAWKGFAMDGEWVYGLLSVGTDTYVMVGRERKGNEPGLGPMIWDTWLYFAGASSAAWLSSLSTPPRLYFGKGNNLSYVKLSAGYGAPDVSGSDYRFALSGSRYTHRLRFDDWGDKDYPFIDIAGKSLDASTYWDVYFSIDGGAYSNLDVNGAAMRKQTNGRTRFFLPTTASGREIQFRFDYTGASSTAPGELKYFCPFAVPQARKVPAIVVHLLAQQGLHHDEGTEERSADEIFSDLKTLNEQAAAIVASGPWGEDASAYVRRVRKVETYQEGDDEPYFLLEVGLQLRETS